MTPEELEVQLREEAERAIKALVEKYRQSENKTIDEIEAAALAIGKQMKETALRGMIAARPSDAALSACPQCGGSLRRKGQRAKWVHTQAGEAQVSRDYYYCEACGTGFFPSDRRMGLVHGLYSAGMAQQMVWLSGLLTFGQCSVGRSSIWRQFQAHGTNWLAQAEHDQSQVNPERLQLGAVGADHATPKGVSLDGGMVNIRGQGWKEMKVGVIYDVSARLEYDEHSEEYIAMPHAENLAYRAVLGAVDSFRPALWALAVAHALPTARKSSVTADGAEWIWNISADLFPDSAQIVDWFHACDHLAQAAEALFSTDPKRAKVWYQQRQDDLFLGNLQAITLPLDKATLAQFSHYFHHHQRRMQYQEFREEGLPIGSGTVESGVKQFKTRLTAAGMRWNPESAQRMLLIRAAVLDHSFDVRWQQAA